MGETINVYVFGDQTYDISDQLRVLIQTKHSLALSNFLDESSRVLKREVFGLRQEQQRRCPRFSKISGLIRFWEGGTLNPALAQALTCICHIGTFLCNHVSSRGVFSKTANNCFVGRCTGYLSAVAVSCASNPSELLHIGLQTVALAFRIGARAWEMGNRLYSKADHNREHSNNGIYPSWVVALTGPSYEEVHKYIDGFNGEKMLGKITAPYVSARLSNKRCSVSGPPNILNPLLATSSLADVPHLQVSVTAPYHAPHLYTREDVDSILSDVATFSTPTLIPIISSSTGDVIQSIPFPDAARLAVEAYLRHTLRLDLIPDAVASHIQHTREVEAFSIHYIGASSDGLGASVQSRLGGLYRRIDSHLHLQRIESPSLEEVPASKSKIAILSMSGRFPRASNMDKFWHILEQGVDTHEVVPPSRWDFRTHRGDPSLRAMPKNKSGTAFGCWLHDAAQFDARFFNMSPREAPQVDPAQRMALLTAAEALEQAGIVPGRTASTQKDRVGVYFGCTSNDWMETNSAQDIDTYFIPGGNRAFIPGRINYHFKFSGPSYTIDTACSSSLAAIHLACNALWKGEVDTAIVGGTNVLTNPDMTAGLDRGHFLSRTGNCKTFDDEADGYCRGEAVATAILKRLDDAIADKDPVQACILSIATNHSAEASSITRPHVGAQEDLFHQVLSDAGVATNDITYCEMHGTGTQAGDAGETLSVLQTLAPIEPSRAKRSPHERLYIGAAKSCVGHGEAAAGVTSLAKVLLMMKNSTIPRHCGIKTKLNHRLPDLGLRNVAVATSSIPWPGPNDGGQMRKVLLNNFSAAGGNTAMVLEDAPKIIPSQTKDPRKSHVVAVSAKTAVSLENNLSSLISWIDAQQGAQDLTLAKLSYTSTARRMHHPHRVMVNASDLSSTKRLLQQSLDWKLGSNRLIGQPRYIFAFTGQGAHFAGMGSDLYSKISSFRSDIQSYDGLCQQSGFPSIEGFFKCPEEAYKDASPTELQLTSVCFQMALYRMWISLNIFPSAVVGHSLGEYAALYAASVLTQAEVISLTGRRAHLLEKHCQERSHAMLAVRSSIETLQSIIGTPGANYDVSCLNGRENVVIGAEKFEIEHIRPELTRNNLSSTLLDIPYAYHTAQVDPILSELDTIARNMSFAKPSVPVISPAYGKVLTEAADFGPDYITRHCRGAVDMLSALSSANDLCLLDEKTVGIEIGPAMVVTKMVKEIAGPNFKTFASIRKGEDSWKILTTALSSFYTAGADIDWMFYHSDFDSCQEVLELPAYAWQMQDYWMQYVHDWSLRKGDPPLQAEPVCLESSTIHKVVQNDLSTAGGDLIVEADLSRPDLNPMVQGHKVYGVPLCTPSVYADIALTIGNYAKQFFPRLNGSIGVEVAEMTIQSALVANSEGLQQLLRTTAHLDSSNNTLFCAFSSVTDSGVVSEQHATCLIRMFDIDSMRESITKSVDKARARIPMLKNQIGEVGNTFRYSKAMIYKMVGQLADFDPNYRALKEITLDSDNLEATGSVDFTGILNEGEFHTNPAFIDALSQLGGFVMNANEGVDLEKELFVNHGWQSFRLFEPIDQLKEYTSHVIMSEGNDELWSGDIIIFDGDRTVGMFQGVALQGVPKRLMQYIVNTVNKRLSKLVPGKPKDKEVRPMSIPAARAADDTAKLATTTVTKLQAPSDPDAIKVAMDIISQESGIAAAQLTDVTLFDDIGVDSLLSLMVCSKIRDELNLEITSSSFLEAKTVGAFKAHILALVGTTGKATTPTEVTKVVQETTVSIPEPFNAQSNPDLEDSWLKVIHILAEESGVSSTELKGDIHFSDIGVDSLLSLVICSRMRDEIDLDLPDHSIFLDRPTVGSLKDLVTSTTSACSISESDQPTSQSESSEPMNPLEVFPVGASQEYCPEQDSLVDLKAQPLPPISPAWSITLQGSSKHAKSRLFLFPDGCGAATSYLKIPAIATGVAVIGFNCPFMKNPEAMGERTLTEVVSSYVEGVRKHQPHGPYHLGGWSAGGIVAYAVAQVLIKAGEEVASLLLIDSPAPTKGLDRLPRRFFDHCQQVGIFGSEMGAIHGQRPGVQQPPLPEWLLPHFRASIELLHDYHAPPMPTSNSTSLRNVTIVWAGACAFDGQYAPLPPTTSDDEDTEGMKFLTEPRRDFGPCEWAELFPGRSINCHIVEAHHHFSMMRGQGAEQLAGYIRGALFV